MEDLQGTMLRHLLVWSCPGTGPVLVLSRSRLGPVWVLIYVHLAEFSFSYSLVVGVFVRYIFNSLTMYEKKYFSEKLRSFFCSTSLFLKCNKLATNFDGCPKE